MCVIVVKEKHRNLPKIEDLKNCFINNPDGAGFMYTDKNKVIIDKGYMSFDDFKKRYDNLCKMYNNFNNKSLVMHFRIGTSSSNTEENTHPYPITNKEKVLHALDLTCDLGVVHNGIISNYNPKGKNPTTNDTQQFIMRYLYPLYNNFKDFYKVKSMRKGIEYITNSKFAFLDKNDKVYYVGDFIDYKGIKYSNSSYLSYETLYYPSNTHNYYTGLYQLEPGWHIDLSDGTVDVKNKNLYYDMYECNVYELKNNEYMLVYKDAIIYDENYLEVF